MTPQDYEIALLARTAFVLSLSDSVDEMIGIACTLRNWVVPDIGKTPRYASYTEACLEFLKCYPTRPEPLMVEDSFTHPERGLLAVIDQIYNCEHPDLTRTKTTPGALYFARAASLTPEDWRWPIVNGRQPVAMFGAQQFFS